MNKQHTLLNDHQYGVANIARWKMPSFYSTTSELSGGKDQIALPISKQLTNTLPASEQPNKVPTASE